MSEKNRKETALVVAAEQGAVQKPQQPQSYWARVSACYQHGFFVLLFALAVFVVMFIVLCADAFRYEGLLYFGKDVKNVVSGSHESGDTVSYDYRANATRLAYHGGYAVIGTDGTEIYASDGERLLQVQRAQVAPRAAVSRDHLVVYEQGGKSFYVCNSYAVLFEGTCEETIYGAFVSDAGYFALIVGGGERSLSAVLLYDGNFNLVGRYNRVGATISAVISANGQRLAIVDATAEGTLVDVYMIGDTNPLSSTALKGFPLTADFTAANKLAVLTDLGCHTLKTNGRVYESVYFDGALPVAFHISREGVCVVLESGRTNSVYRVLVLNKKGSVKLDYLHYGSVTAVALADKTLWLLAEDDLKAISVKNGEVAASIALGDRALGIALSERDRACVLYPARAVTYRAEGNG